MYQYNAEVLRVIDGDTYELLVDCGFGIFHKIHLRVAGINTPEITGAEKPEGLRAKKYVEEFFTAHENVAIIQTQYRRTFTRWVGDIFVDGINVADHLILQGHGVEMKR